MQLVLKEFALPLKHIFRISRESHDVQPSLIVELRKGNLSGLGEATSNPYYNVSVDKMKSDLLSIVDIIKDLSDRNTEEFWNCIYPHLRHNMFALCALDMAYSDLYSKLQNKKLYQLWGYDISKNPMTNYTIGLDSIEKMISKMKEMPWPIYKIKLGSDNDMEIIREMRKHSDAIFRVDANCGWSVEQTIDNSRELKKLGVEFIEQPLPADNWEGQSRVFNQSVLPIIADESCQIEEDVSKCYGFFHGVNVKLTKCGGLTPARRMLNQAKELGMKTMVGCMTESSVGISAIAHLLPLLDYVDMDGALLLSQDIAEGVKIEDGRIAYADRTGIGATLKD